jgi:hypothetical protein
VCLCLLGPRVPVYTTKILSMFVSLVYCVESTVRWFVVREKHCWMTADSADKSKRTGRLLVVYSNIDALRTAGMLKSKMCFKIVFF